MHSSNLINEDDVNKRSVHTLMCHSARTAEKHYMINRLGDATAKGHKVLVENIKLKDTLSSPVLTPYSDEALTASHLSPQQLQDIKLIFSEVIATNSPLSLKETCNLMSESMHLVTEVDNDSIVKRVYKRVKYLQTCEWDKAIDNVPVSDPNTTVRDWVDSSTSLSEGSSRRHSWPRADKEVILQAFQP